MASALTRYPPSGKKRCNFPRDVPASFPPDGGAPQNGATWPVAARNAASVHRRQVLQFRAQVETVERAKPYVYSQTHATTHDPQTIANLKA